MSATSTQAISSECPPNRATPRVEIELVQDPPQYDRMYSIHQLKSMYDRHSPTTTAAWTNNSAHFPLGITAVKAKYEYGLEAQITTLPNGLHCASLSAIKITFRFSDTKVHIARELPRGSCIENEVILHENKHIAVDKQIVNKWRNKITSIAQQRALQLGTVPVNNPRNGPTVLGNRLRPTLDKAFDSLLRERDRLQSEVDSTQEYARMSRVCNYAASEIVKNALGR